MPGPYARYLIPLVNPKSGNAIKVHYPTRQKQNAMKPPTKKQQDARDRFAAESKRTHGFRGEDYVPKSIKQEGSGLRFR